MTSKKIICVLTMLMAVCMVLNGCSSTLSLENSELMRPPRATGDRAEIQEVIDQNAGSGYTLKYPQGGDYRSAIIMYDITGDGNDEALAIYRTSGDDAETHVIIIDEVNGTWSLVGDFSNSSPEVSQVVFADLDGDRTAEILVGFSSYSSVFSSLAVYSYNGINSQNVSVNETYSNLILGDFTGNGIQEIALVSMFNNDTPANARLMYYNKDSNTLNARSTVEMDSGVSRFISIIYCRISKDTYGIAADGQGVDNNYYTQLIYFDQITGQLKNSLYTAINENKSMHRQDGAVCVDIDKDGVVEIPISNKMPFDAAEEIEDLVASELTYNEYSTADSLFTEGDHYIANQDYGYLYRIPHALYGQITARKDPASGTMSVFKLRTDPETGEHTNQIGALIFTIKAFDPDDWEHNGGESGYSLALRTDSYVLGFTVPKDSPYPVSQQEMVSSILITDAL